MDGGSVGGGDSKCRKRSRRERYRPRSVRRSYLRRRLGDAIYAEDWEIDLEEAQRRLNLQRGSIRLRIDQAARELAPETYSATWWNHESFAVEVAVTGDAAALAASLQEQFPQVLIRGVDVEHSAWDIESTYLALVGLRYADDLGGARPVTWSVLTDPIANRVVVRAAGDTNAAFSLHDQIAEYIERSPVDVDASLQRISSARASDGADTQVGVDEVASTSPREQVTRQTALSDDTANLDRIVDFEAASGYSDEDQTSCTGRGHCYPLRAGLHPYIVYNTGETGYCSSGFSVTQGSSRGTLTSGHCSLSPFNQTVRHGGTTSSHNIGSVTGRYDADAVDALWVRIANPPFQNAYVYSTLKVTGLRPYSGLGASEYVCSYYGKSYTTDGCGYVQTNQASSGNNYNVIAISEAYMDSTIGDSGSPYMFGTLAAGIHNGAGDGYVYFSSAELVLNSLQVALSTTS